MVAEGRVYIGTNNELALNPKEPGDRAVLMYFRESDGQFLWQHTHQKLEDSNQDWPDTGLCSTPLVEGDRVYYVGTIGGTVQTVIGGGDGWVRGYDALRGSKLWEFDTNPGNW